MKANKKMMRLLKGIDLRGVYLSEDAQEILDHGFVESDGGLFFSLMKNRNLHIVRRDFPDTIGFECFVNSFHMEDFSEKFHLECALIFVEKCLLIWRESVEICDLRFIVSHSGKETVLRFHMIREGEFWLEDDLDLYGNAILVVDSTDHFNVNELVF